jgi:hypothetical protein
MNQTNKNQKKNAVLAACAVLAISIIPTKAEPKEATAPVRENTEGQLQIVYTPKKLMEENLKSGKLKENVFYWCQEKDRTTTPPKGEKEGDKTFLRIDGAFEPLAKNYSVRAAEGESVIKLYRAYNIPEGKTKAIIKMNCRKFYDPWNDKLSTSASTENPAGWSTPRGMTYVTNNGKALTMPLALPPTENEWAITKTEINTPSGSQQLVLEISTKAFKPVDIASMEVEFH